MIVQYLSAKLGIVTGQSLPEILGNRLSRPVRISYWLQAELVAAATDLAEVIGGALALHLLFNIPLLWGGIIIGIVSMALLLIQGRGYQRRFEAVIIALLLVITLGFLAGLLVSPPAWDRTALGLLPRFNGSDSVLVAASMLGATVMPHAVYLHSSLVNDHTPLPSQHNQHNAQEGVSEDTFTAPETTSRWIAHHLKATRIDVLWALSLAGIVNIGLLLLAASALEGVQGTDTIEGAYAAIAQGLGPVIATIFAVGLLASGLASTSVGAYAGSEIMRGLLHIKVPLLLRRLITLVPALVILAFGVEPTWALVISQVMLSFGIPFALIPLIRLTADRTLMDRHANSLPLRISAAAIALAIVALNILLIYFTLIGQA